MIFKKLTALLDTATDNFWRRVDWHRSRFTGDLSDLLQRYFPILPDKKLVSVVFLLETDNGKTLTLGAEPLALRIGYSGSLVFRPYTLGSLKQVNIFGTGCVVDSFNVGQENLFASTEPAPLEWLVLYNILPLKVDPGTCITINVRRLL